MAAVIDIILVMGPVYCICLILAIIFPNIWEIYTPALIILFFLMEYYFFFCVKKDSVGKVIQGVHVVAKEGQEIKFEQFLVRSLIKSFSIFTFGGIVAAISLLMIVFSDNLALHDRISGTKVIWKK